MVSTSARKCPNCGERNPTTPPFSELSTPGKVFVAGGTSIVTILFVIGFICLFIILLAFC